MGLYAATPIGVGAMVGAGIFPIFGTAVKISGNVVYVSFIIAGVVTLLNAYSYAKLAVRYQSAGGLSNFDKLRLKGFGDGVLSSGFNLLLWVSYVFALALLFKRVFFVYSNLSASRLGTGMGKSFCNCNYPDLYCYKLHRSKSRRKIGDIYCLYKIWHIAAFCSYRHCLHECRKSLDFYMASL
jgi:amino acid transporter